MSLLIEGEEEGRLPGLSSVDPSRRRVSGQAISAGSLSKQQNPVANDSMSKEAMVSCLEHIHIILFLVIFYFLSLA